MFSRLFSCFLLIYACYSRRTHFQYLENEFITCFIDETLTTLSLTPQRNEYICKGNKYMAVVSKSNINGNITDCDGIAIYNENISSVWSTVNGFDNYLYHYNNINNIAIDINYLCNPHEYGFYAFPFAKNEVICSVDVLNNYYSITIPTATACTNEYRLIKEIYPSQYNITLKPYFENDTFLGNEIIDITIDKNLFILNEFNDNQPFAIKISVNRIGCTIINALLLLMNETYDLLNEIYDNHSTTSLLQFNNLFYSDVYEIINQTNSDINCKLFITFNGSIGGTTTKNSPILGWYLSEYEINNHTVKNYLTQFQAIEARKVFPSFDEPEKKAVYKMNIIAPFNTTVLGNMPVINTILLDEFDCAYNYPFDSVDTGQCKLVQFMDTPIMSNYILAFAVGFYQNITEVITNSDGEPLLHSIYYQYDHPLTNSVAFSLNISNILLHEFETIFGVSYNLPKLDSLNAMQFNYGAMENWGLILYANAFPFLVPTNATLSDLRRAVSVIGHELNHQWFGNKITYDWWDEGYLNEGFATYYDIYALDYYDKRFNAFWSNKRESHNIYMLQDATLYSTPLVRLKLNYYANTGGDPLRKSNIILKMVERYMGYENYYKALNNLLNKYKYKNVNSMQLFREYGFGSYNMSWIFSWIFKTGFPLITAQVKQYYFNTETHALNIQFVFKQKRYSCLGRFKFNDSDIDIVDVLQFDDLYDEKNELFPVPLYLSVDGAVQSLGLFDRETFEFELTFNDMAHEDDFYNFYFVFNDDFNGYFRVHYDEILLKLIINHWDRMSFGNQLSVIYDMSQNMQFNYLDIDIYLDFIQDIEAYLHSITDKMYELNEEEFYLYYSMVEVISNAFIFVDENVCSLQLEFVINEFRTFCIKLFKPIYIKTFEWEHIETRFKASDIRISWWNSEDWKNLKLTVLNTLIRFNDKDVIKNGFDAYNLYNISDSISDDIDNLFLLPLFKAALSYDKELIFDYLETLNSQTSLKNIIIQSFSVMYRFNDNDLFNNLTDFVINNNEYNVGLNSLMTCDAKFIVLDKFIGNESNLFNDIIEYENIDTTYPWQLFKSFGSAHAFNQIFEIMYNPNIFPQQSYDVKRISNMTMQNIATNIIWVNNQVQILNNWLKSEHDEANFPYWIIIVVVIIVFVMVAIKWVFVKRKFRTKKFRSTATYEHFNEVDIPKYGVA